jgi:soluble lytic murein transglycosylase-like protein
VIPTVRDAIGAPVPGLSGVRPRPVPVPVQFRDVLRQLRTRPTTTGVPATGGAVPRVRRSNAVHRTTAPARADAPVKLNRSHPMLPSPLTNPSVAALASEPAATSLRPDRTGAKQRLVDAIHTASEHAGLEPALSVAVARAESSLNPKARSADGLSVGTFQVTHQTAAEMRRKIARGAVDRPPGSDDVALGVGYLRYLHDLFGREAKLGHGLSTVPIEDGDERQLFAVAAFNAGEGRVAQAQQRAEKAGLDPTRFAHVKPFLPRITQGYVERVSTYAREEAGVEAA